MVWDSNLREAAQLVPCFGQQSPDTQSQPIVWLVFFIYSVRLDIISFGFSKGMILTFHPRLYWTSAPSRKLYAGVLHTALL